MSEQPAVPFDIIFSPEARDDLKHLYVFVAERSSEERALAYVERIEVFCGRLSTFPQRGMRRDDLRPGLRVIGFQRRVCIAFHIDATSVVFDRILYGGQNLSTAFDRP